MSKICVIIPMYGHADLTLRCIEFTLKNAGMPVDIVVVDDGSKEPFIYHDNDHVFVHRLEQNSGYTNATNQGIIWAMKRNYDYVHLLNNDTEPEPDFIKYLYDAIKSNKDIGVACSARISNLTGKRMIENYAVDLISGYQAFSHEDIPEDIIYCCWIPVASALVPIEVMLHVGLLDRRMRNHCSDNDWCVRCNQLGFRVALVPKSKVYHIHQVTTNGVGAVATADQEILLQKVACVYYSEVMKKMPLDDGKKIYGKLEFSTYTK